MQTVEVLTALAMVFRSLLSFEGIEMESHVEKLTGQKKIKIKILARVWYIDFNWFHFWPTSIVEEERENIFL